MKINSIKSNLNFGKVLKVKQVQENNFVRGRGAFYSGLEQLANVLNNEPTDVYTREEKTEIKKFFNNVLEEDLGKTPVKFKHVIDLGVLLLTGEDAIGVDNKIGVALDDYPKVKQEQDDLFDRFGGKLKDDILLLSSTGDNPADKKKFIKLDKFNYVDENIFYTSLTDGTVCEDLGESRFSSERYNCKNVSYRNEQLIL